MVKASQLKSYLSKFDLFGERIGFNIDGKESYSSLIGLFMSFVTLTVMCIYSVTRMVILVNIGDTRYTSRSQESVYDNDLQIEFLDTDIDFVFNIVIPETEFRVDQVAEVYLI